MRILAALLAFGCAPQPEPAFACPAGSRLEGNSCIAERVDCPAGTRWVDRRCTPAPSDAAAPPRAPCEELAECESRCEQGEAASCGQAGLRLEGRDRDRARTLFAKACAQRDPEGCYQLARAWGDEASRVANYRIACDGGHAQACNNLAYRYERGEGVEPDPARARSLYQRGCDGGSAMACSNLGVSVKDGIGGPKDVARAAALFRSACDAGHPAACTYLGLLHESGEGAPRDLGVARHLYGLACGGDHGQACNQLGLLSDDPFHARALFKKSCDFGYANGCTNLGRSLLESGSPSYAEAAELFDRACREQDREACDELVVTIAQAKRACARRAADCYHLGHSTERGIGVPADETAAGKLYQRACQTGFPPACTALGHLHERGAGVPLDAKRALELYTQACARKHARGCRLAEALRAR
jgi:uncharacterized protein